jgi:hypothetical protein
MSAERICVYTALFGSYERLNPQPVAEASDVDWICFTDDPEVTSDDWEVVVVEPAFALDPVRSSRGVKIRPPTRVRDYDASLWIDNSVILDADPRRLVSQWLQDDDVVFASHSYRSTVLDEFLVVLDDQLDDPSRILEQLDHYARTQPASLEGRPCWNAIIPRRWSARVDEAMNVWWEQVLRYSRRDQLSLLYSLDSVHLAPRRVEVDNFESEWHRWPISPERKGAMRHLSTDNVLRRPLARTFELEGEVARLTDALEVARREVEQRRRELEAMTECSDDHERARNAAELRLVHVLEVELPAVTSELNRHRALLAEDEGRLDALAGDRTRLEQSNAELGRQLLAVTAELDAIRRSRSWRTARKLSRSAQAVTNPIRRR